MKVETIVAIGNAWTESAFAETVIHIFAADGAQGIAAGDVIEITA